MKTREVIQKAPCCTTLLENNLNRRLLRDPEVRFSALCVVFIFISRLLSDKYPDLKKLTHPVSMIE